MELRCSEDWHLFAGNFINKSGPPFHLNRPYTTIPQNISNTELGQMIISFIDGNSVL